MKKITLFALIYSLLVFSLFAFCTMNNIDIILILWAAVFLLSITLLITDGHITRGFGSIRGDAMQNAYDMQYIEEREKQVRNKKNDSTLSTVILLLLLPLLLCVIIYYVFL